MEGMQITSTLSFAASSERVAEMLVNPGFAEHVGQKIKAGNVTTTEVDNGLTSVFTLETPEAARMIVGNQLTVTETVIWAEPHSDGSRDGRLTLSVTGVPATVDSTLQLRPAPSGSTITYDADFTVRIPLVGKKIEEMAEKHLTRIMEACESVGATWLESHP